MDNGERNRLRDCHKFNTIDISGRQWTICPQFRKQEIRTPGLAPMGRCRSQQTLSKRSGDT
jgi:hypothetical protein